MTTATINYGTTTAVTLSPASLASSGTYIAGRESTEIDNTSNKFLNAEVQGFITTGTTPTVDTYIKLFVWASHTSLGTTALDVLDGTDSAETFTSVDIMSSIVTLVRSVKVNATSDQKYHFKPFTIADIFGEMPKYWGLYLAHDTVAALNSTAGNHEFKYTGIKFDSA
ncbi:MAG: hypothetical protein AB9Q17_02385 [Candidatus Reddybacter sp.]